MNKYRTWVQVSRLFIVFLIVVFPSFAFAAPSAQGEDPQAQADALYEEGSSLYDQGDYEAAISRFESALTIYEEIGDRQGQAQTLHGIGLAYNILGEYALALKYEEQALTNAREIRDQMREEIILGSLGELYLKLADYDQALEYSQRSLLIAQELGDRQGEEIALFHIGQVYNKLGQYEPALDHYQQSLTIAQELGDRAVEEAIYNDMGLAYSGLEQYQEALDYFERSLVLAQELDDRLSEGITLKHIGQIYLKLGKFTEALERLQRSLALAQELGDRQEEGARLNDIGLIYASLGQDEKAIDYLQQSLVIAQELGDREGEAYTLNNMANLISLDQYEQALDYLQEALAIARETGLQPLEAATLINIGQVYERLGEYADATEYYEQALVMEQGSGNRFTEAVILNNIGFVYKQSGQNVQALDYYQRALAIVQELGDQQQTGITLNNMGRLYEQQGDKVRAIDSYQQAIEITEALVGEIKVEEFRASLISEYIARYEALISVLWTEGRFEEAFNYTERARARVFLDQLAGGSIDFRAGVDANLLKREDSLSREILALRDQLLTLRSGSQNDWDTGAITAAQTELADREADYAQLLTDIKLQSPEVAGLVSVDVASLADIQSLLDSNTTLVEYFVMQDRTMAFIITGHSLETVAVDVNRDDLNRVINDFRDFASLEDPHPASLQQLYAWLIAPLKDKLTTSMIGIIPHGVLHYLPFAALTDGAHYLGEEYTVFALPSASALRFIQEKRKPPINTVLAMGNPTTVEPGLTPLKFAQQEVETIASMFSTQLLIGDSATESKLRSEAPSAGIIHLAAHGQFNSDNPLFSALYLAGDTQQDGRLEVHEIYNLNLTQATNLVVLSACETQVGAVSAGDEVVGMTRAFLYAGTPTVIASLWNVDDKATTLLMQRFYTHLQKGMAKAQALQEAQSEVRAQYPHPYYWAAFVLTGDAGSTVLAESTPLPPVDNRMSPAVGIGALLVLGVGCLSMVGILAGVIVWRRRQKRVGS